MSITEKGFKIEEENLTEIQAENSHLKSLESNNGQYKCGLCFISFPSKVPLLIHLREEHWAKGTKNEMNAPSFDFSVEKRRTRVNIIKEEDILHNEQELSKKMIFNTNTQEKTLSVTDDCFKANDDEYLGKRPLRVIAVDAELPSEELTRASTKKGDKAIVGSAEMTPVKLNDRAQKKLRRTTPSSPYSHQQVPHFTVKIIQLSNIFISKKKSFFFSSSQNISIIFSLISFSNFFSSRTN